MVKQYFKVKKEKILKAQSETYNSELKRKLCFRIIETNRIELNFGNVINEGESIVYLCYERPETQPERNCVRRMIQKLELISK